MQPIYFLPNLRAAEAESPPQRPAILKARGLAEVFAGVKFEEQPCYELRGSLTACGDAGGCLLCYQTPAGGIPKQWGNTGVNDLSWTPIGDGSLLWIGVDRADPPRPEELARPRINRGYDIELGDGQTWKVPVIRRPDSSSYLPCAFVRGSDGRRVEKLRAEYQADFDAFRPAAEWFYDGKDPAAQDRELIIDLAIRALSINYRYSPNEQDVIQLVGQENLNLIVAAAVDYPSYDATVQKKTPGQSAELNSTAGQPAVSTTPTGQASQTSNS
jgi:hypothetical protein